MPPATSGDRLDRAGELAVLDLQFEQRIVTALRGVDVERKETSNGASRHSDIGFRSPFPPASNHRFVGRRFLHAMDGDRVLAWTTARLEIAAGAAGHSICSEDGSMQGDDRPVQ